MLAPSAVALTPTVNADDDPRLCIPRDLRDELIALSLSLDQTLTLDPQISITILGLPSMAITLVLGAALPFETLDAASYSRPSFQWFDAHNFSTGGGSGEVSFHADGGEVSLSGAVRTVYGKLVPFTGTKLGFSTNFSFSVAVGGDDGPFNLAFLLVPSAATPPTLESTNEQNHDWIKMSVFSVQYASSIEVNVDIPGEPPTGSEDISGIDLKIGSGRKLQSWIGYDGESKKLEVRLINFGDPKLSGYSVHYYIDLSSILWSEEMLVGFSFWSKSSTGRSNVYSWDFELNHGGDYKMHSEPLDPDSLLPVKPPEDHKVLSTQGARAYPWRFLVMVVFGAACGVLMMYAVLIIWSAMFDRQPVAPMEYPEKPLENEYEKVVMAADSVGVDNAAK